MQDRKQFLINSLSIAAGSLLFGFRTGNASVAATDNPDYLSFDLHCHPGRIFDTAGELGPKVDFSKTLDDMDQSHVGGAFFAMVADSKLLKAGATGIIITGKYEPGEAWAAYKAQLKNIKDLLQKSAVRQGRNVADLKQPDKVAAYLAVEGGDFLEGKADMLDEVYEDGVRSVQLVHYVQNDLGDLQTAPSVYNGLSPFGKEVVRKMNRLGLVIDVAHASFQTTKSVADLTDSPIMLSHSVLEMEPGRPMAKRAISKDHAKLVAMTGGLIGIWPSGFNKNMDDLADNTLRMIEVAGIDHVGIGTDMDANFKPVLSSYLQLPSFAATLKTKGLSENEIGKIMGGNAAKLLGKVIKK